MDFVLCLFLLAATPTQTVVELRRITNELLDAVAPAMTVFRRSAPDGSHPR